MAINGTEFINDPWGTVFSPFTDFFNNILPGVDVGHLFYLFPLIVLAFGVQIKTESGLMTSMFIIGSGALLGLSGIFVGATQIAVVFLVFSALGIVGMVTSLLFQK